MLDIYSEFLQLARLALSGRKPDVVMLLRRISRRTGDLSASPPEFSEKLQQLLSQSDDSGPGEALRRVSMSTPPGRSQDTPTFTKPQELDLNVQPVWPSNVSTSLTDILFERQKLAELRSARVEPTRTLLFIGPPGVGKTLAAKWLAHSLSRELKVLHIASVMSSYLGRTGANLSAVLEDAANNNAILLLDEFDSIGKRRDDTSDVGELKRLVNVLLQALDDWSGDGLLIAATNHPELLDRAIWRRFDKVIEFPLPDNKYLVEFSSHFLKKSGFDIGFEITELVAIALSGRSFADAGLWLSQCIRSAIVHGKDIEETMRLESKAILETRSIPDRVRAARLLVESGLSQRQASELVCISRDTIRKYANLNTKEA